MISLGFSVTKKQPLWDSFHGAASFVEHFQLQWNLTVTSAQMQPPDLPSVEKVLAKVMVKLSRKNSPHDGYLQSTANGGYWLLSQATFCSQIKQKIKKMIDFFLFRKHKFFTCH